MKTDRVYHDSFKHLSQAGGGTGVLLARIVAAETGNRYSAVAVEFDGDGLTQPVGDEVVVTNLAEDPSAGGNLPAGTEALAVDTEGRWVVHVRAFGTAVFAARVIAHAGTAGRYIVREQALSPEGTFEDKPGADDVTATNLAELSLGDGAAVDDDTIVLVHAVPDTGEPPTPRHVFDHPAYAKYLD